MASRSRTAPSDLLAAIAAAPAAQALRRRLEAGGVFSCDAIHPAAQPFLAALLHRLRPSLPLLVVTEGLKTQERLHEDLTTWMRLASAHSVEQPLFHPAWEVFPHEGHLPHVDVISERLVTLTTLSGLGGLPSPAAPVIVTSVAALMQRTFPPAILAQRLRPLHRGETLDPLDLVEWLEDQGYEPEAKVSQKGELSLRGGILDVFPPISPWPLRLEFFGNELDSLRYFDPITQISREQTSEAILCPAGEMGLLKRLVAPQGEAPVQLGTLLDYLPPQAMVMLCEPDDLDARAEPYAQAIPAGDPLFISWPELQQRMESGGMCVVQTADTGVGVVTLPGDAAISGTLNDTPLSPALFPRVAGGEGEAPTGTDRQAGEFGVRDESVEVAPPADSDAAARAGWQCPLALSSLETFRPLENSTPAPQVAEAQRREFFAQLHRWLRQGYSVHVFCNNDGERQRFEEIWEELTGAAASPSSGGSTKARAGVRSPTLHLGALARGFICEAAQMVVVTDAEVFGRYKILRPRRLKSPHAQAVRSVLNIDFSEIEEGDYVVHLQHGIGRYMGLKDLPKEAGGHECLVIEYATTQDGMPPPRLYVPVSEAHLVSKYIGAGKARPSLNTLGGARWAKTKTQAETAVRDLAAELLSIQAKRAAQPGHAFPGDTPWQREFESAFIYEETFDQARAIQDAKRDLEAAKPMDRLICGDVGFGKTEVAIRAAFKAVMGGKQVAVLVPTTVLAQQHYNTFRERMADYPIRVELLSRFRSPREQKRVARDLGTGGVDIVIGTHRLVQGDITFKDLGLVIVDEEQRFGVLQKEKLKRLRHMVDILTLSATPIPRTLYLAMCGARDMSTIETPPQDRLPVKTIVSQYDERVIRDAIRQELQREGQVFYLHNRVYDIASVADRLRALVPEARLVVGHGQMGDDELEEVMTRFVNGEADVLVSTTIIESGLDIPNANTIIIDRADRFGLSDLYQLRGRVGRYKHQAYAYLLLPRHAALLVDARKRLNAIKQYATLGSGFKIAMRDLEIRGAGNLLGPQQSGHITAVGFELYCQLLKQSVATMKGEKPARRPDTLVRLDFIVSNPSQADAEERPASGKRPRRRVQEPEVEVPRDVAAYATPKVAQNTEPVFSAGKAAACLPFSYIPDARQRIEVYRKLAEVSSPEDLAALAKEMRDRFGPAPRPVNLVLELTGLKLLATSKNVTLIEAKEGKLMLTRNSDFVMTNGRFPRLTGRTAEEGLKEIRRILETL